jgi:hypothetical protein
VIVSYESKSSDFMWVSVWLRCRMLSRMCLVCVIGMLEYIFVMSREAKLEVGLMGVCCSSWIRSVVFFMLKVFGSGTNCELLDVKCLASL